MVTNRWLITVASAIVAFVATNIDDLLVLTVFFTRVNQRLRWQQVVLGQYVGFLALIAASLPGYLGGMFLPKSLIGWLGLVPIAIGVSLWMRRESATEIEQTEAAVETQLESTIASKRKPGLLSHLLQPQTYGVAVVTFANGGDNIGIYVPLFASSDQSQLIVTLLTFLIMVAVWCFVAYRLTHYPAIARLLTRYGHVIVPIVLISLGIYILWENGSLKMVGVG